MKTPLAVLLLATVLVSAPQAVRAEGCGGVTIAQMSWKSADLMAEVDRIILSEGYGCDARTVPGDTLPTFESMLTEGQPDVAPEMWINAVRERLDAAVDEGRLEVAAQSLSDSGVEGWWIPAFITEENPDIKTVRDALRRPDLFPSPDDPARGALHNCPPDWSCRISTANLFRAHAADEKGFDLINTDTPQALIDSVADAFANQRGWLGYYWAPTPLLGRYDMVRLDFEVPHNKIEWDTCTAVQDCAEPKPNAWPKSEVYTVVTGKFRRRGGDAYRYLASRSWSNRTVNGLMAWMEDNRATAEETARYFLESNEALWSSWVTQDAAERLKSFLANS